MAPIDDHMKIQLWTAMGQHHDRPGHAVDHQIARGNETAAPVLLRDILRMRSGRQQQSKCRLYFQRVCTVHRRV